MTIAILDARDKEYVVVAAGADIIATYVQQAILAGQTAQEVLDAILAAGLSEGVFPSEAAGLSGTTNGEYFWVGDGGTVTLYLNDSGTGDEIAELATMAALATRPTFTELAGDTGADLVGATGGGTVQDGLDGRPTAAALAATTGADTIGKTGGGTVQDFIDSFGASISYTVQASGGDFTDFVTALDFLKTQPLNRPTTLTVTGAYTVPSAGYTFDHPNSRNLIITGPAFGGGKGVITNAAMTGTRATDLAYCTGRYDAIITIDGTDDVSASGGGGLSFPRGLSAINRILFIEKGRYSLDFGFNRGHLNAFGPSGCAFTDCAFFGSVWAVIGYRAHFAFAGTGNWFGYQINGGALGLFKSSVEFVAGASNKLYFFQPATATADGPKYAIYADDSYLAINADAVASAIFAKGSWLHGVYAINGSSGDVRLMAFDGVTQPFTIGEASLNITGAAISNANPTNTSLVPGSVQPGVPGNEVGGSLVSVGAGGSVRHNGFTIASSVAARYVFCNGGEIKGYGTIAVTGSKATTAAVAIAASKGNVMTMTVASPQSGSLDQSLCSQNGDIFWFSSSGLTFSPVKNTPTNGSGNYD